MDPKEKNEDEISIVEEEEVEELKSDDEKDDQKEIDSTKDDEKKEVVQKKKPVRKRGNSANQKINQLWQDAKRKQEELRAANAKNSEYEKITASALEESINSKRELIKERLARAQESDDHAKIAELTSELSRVDAQAAQFERYKLEHRVHGDKNQQKQPQQVREEGYEDEPSPPPSFDDLYERQNKAGKAWLEGNRDWYDSDSDNYDEDKVADVTYYAQSLEQMFARTGQGFPPGSRGYFSAIDKYIKENWGENVQEDEEEHVQPAPKIKSYAAPVGNRGAGNGQQKKKEYKITRDEKEMAINMKMKGKDGRELSDDEKIKRFVQLRESTPSSGPISAKNIRS